MTAHMYSSPSMFKLVDIHRKKAEILRGCHVAWMAVWLVWSRQSHMHGAVLLINA